MKYVRICRLCTNLLQWRISIPPSKTPIGAIHLLRTQKTPDFDLLPPLLHSVHFHTPSPYAYVRISLPPNYWRIIWVNVIFESSGKLLDFWYYLIINYSLLMSIRAPVKLAKTSVQVNVLSTGHITSPVWSDIVGLVLGQRGMQPFARIFIKRPPGIKFGCILASRAVPDRRNRGGGSSRGSLAATAPPPVTRFSNRSRHLLDGSTNSSTHALWSVQQPAKFTTSRPIGLERIAPKSRRVYRSGIWWMNIEYVYRID